MFVSYAQNMEDAMLWRALRHLPTGFYVDVGAQDPVFDSVSKAFYDAGWRGAHVEPVAEYAELLRKARPDEQVFQVALGVKAGTQKFFVVPNTGLSTSIKSIADRHRKERNYEVTEIRVPCLTLDQVFEAANRPDIHWLKIDVEGAEREVLSGWNAKRFRPWIIVVEATLPNSTIENFKQWEHLVLDADYRLVYQDGLNRFYVSAEHAGELAPSFKTPPNIFDGITSSGKGGNWGDYLNATFAEREQLQHVKFQGEIAALAARERLSLAAAQEEITSLSGRLLHSDHTRVVNESTLQGRLTEAKLQIETLSADLVARERQLEAAEALHKSLDARAAVVEQKLAIMGGEIDQRLAVAQTELAAAQGEISSLSGRLLHSDHTRVVNESTLQGRLDESKLQVETLTAGLVARERQLEAAERLRKSLEDRAVVLEQKLAVMDGEIGQRLAEAQAEAQARSLLAAQFAIQSERLGAVQNLSAAHQHNLLKREAAITVLDEKVAELTAIERRYADSQEKLSIELSSKSAQLAATTRQREILNAKLASSDHQVAELTRLLHATQQAAASGNAKYASRLAESARALDRLHDKWDAESKRTQRLIAELNAHRQRVELQYNDQVASTQLKTQAHEVQFRALAESLADRNTRLDIALRQQEEQVASARSQARAFENERLVWANTMAGYRARLDAALLHRDQVLASRSWKLTAPLRDLGGVFAKSPATRDTAIVVNLTTARHWRSHPVGIIRVERELARALRANESTRFVFFDAVHRCFRWLSPREVDAILSEAWCVPGLLAGSAGHAHPGPGASVSTMFSGVARYFKPSTVARLSAAYSHVKNTAALLQASTQSRIRSMRRKVIHAAAVAMPGAPRATLAPGDVFVSVGLDWDLSPTADIHRFVSEYGARCVLACYDTVPLIFPEYCVRPNFDRLFQQHFVDVAHTAHRVFAISENSKRDLENFWQEADLATALPEVIALPLASLSAPEVLPPLEPESLARISEVLAGGDYALYVSSFESRKNHRLLISVWHELFLDMGDRCPRLVLVGMAGWGTEDLADEIRRMAAFHAKKIIWLTGVSDAMLQHLYKNCAFTLFPSLYEGWGLAATESMAFGKACVVATGSSLEEATQGLMPTLHPLDFHGWKSIIARLATDTAYRHSLETAISKHYRPRTWQSFADDFTSMIKMTANPVT